MARQMDATKSAGSSRGLSLVELLLVLALVAIAASVVLPSWHDWVLRVRIKAAVNRLIAVINFTRSEAINRQRTVRLCGSGNQSSCDGHWSQGQLVLVGDKIIRHVSPLALGYRLIWRSSLRHNQALSFGASGFTRGQQGSFYFCPKAALQRLARRLIITRSGRWRLNRVKVYGVCSGSSAEQSAAT